MGRAVRYSVLPSERWDKVAPFFEAYPAAMEQLCRTLPERDGDFMFETLTVKSMLECCAGQVPGEVREMCKGRTVAEAAAIHNSLRDGLARFLSFMEATQPPMTAREQMLTSGLMKGNIEEAVLWTLTGVFHLNGFEDAHKLTIYEYETARKNAYNEALVAYRQSVAMEAVRGRR